ncbi:hypothetical protein [Psychroflexus aestuariivivens]|uniref:hypothetical protein n=1 Tax=Psychroflexus aestuariivivens TaxID=1795040 RepID=UPI000FD88FE2|nr:hypothetical protein [Psychroflexus aestuariivivens]
MKAILPLFVRLIAYCGIMFLISLVTQYDFSQGELKEDSLTEISQEILVGLSALLLLIFGSKNKDYKVFCFALSGFLGIHFVREFDFWLNTQLFDKAWQVLALIILVLVVVMLIKNWKKIILETASISKTYGFSFFFSGLIILHVFSRLYGRKIIWIDLLKETHNKYVIEDAGEKVVDIREFMRPVKDASEESIELLAYAIIFIGVVEILIHTSKQRKLN